LTVGLGERGVLDFNELYYEPVFRYSDHTGNEYGFSDSGDGEWLVTKPNGAEAIIVVANSVGSMANRLLDVSVYVALYFYAMATPKNKKVKKLATVIRTRPKGKKSPKKSNNPESNNLDVDLNQEYFGTTLNEYLEVIHPLYTPDSFNEEDLLTFRYAQYNAIIANCMMDPTGAKLTELLVVGRLKQIQIAIDHLEYVIQLRKDILDTFN
jgi:hypothetical protein